MSISVKLHPYLKRFTAGKDLVETTGRTIAECIDDLETKFPGIKSNLFDDSDNLLPLYEVYIKSAKGLRPAELSRPLKDGDEFIIAALIGGG